MVRLKLQTPPTVATMDPEPSVDRASGPECLAQENVFLFLLFLLSVQTNLYLLRDLAEAMHMLLVSGLYQTVKFNHNF